MTFLADLKEQEKNIKNQTSAYIIKVNIWYIIFLLNEK